MNSDVVWITIGANALFLVITIGNTWALAIFNKKSKEAEVTSANVSDRGRARRRRLIVILPSLMLVASIAFLIAIMWFPSANERLNTLCIATSVASSMFSTISLLLLALTDRLYAVSETVGRLVGIAEKHNQIILSLTQPIIAEQSTNKPLQPIAPKDGAPVER